MQYVEVKQYVISKAQVLCPWARHLIRFLILAQLWKTHPNVTEIIDGDVKTKED